VFNGATQDMKRKIQHNAVNNQEDEDSCTYRICFPDDSPVDKKEDKPIENGSGHLLNEESNKKDELTVSRE
jgi:hypothetical protein